MLCQHGSHIDVYCAGEQVKQWTHQVSVECEYVHACVVTRTQHGIHARETRPLPLLAPLLLMALVASPGELGPLPLLALAAQPSPGELGPQALLALLVLLPSPGELAPLPLPTAIGPRPRAPGSLCASHSP